MVVVDDADKLVGKEIEVEFEKYIQTASGRMMFAKRVSITRAKSQKGQRQTRLRGRGSRR